MFAVLSLPNTIGERDLRDRRQAGKGDRERYRMGKIEETERV